MLYEKPDNGCPAGQSIPVVGQHRSEGVKELRASAWTALGFLGAIMELELDLELDLDLDLILDLVLDDSVRAPRIVTKNATEVSHASALCLRNTPRSRSKSRSRSRF
jgi:hypothetical protein